MEKDKTDRRLCRLCRCGFYRLPLLGAFRSICLEEIITAKFTDAYPACSITMKNVVPDFPPGLRIEKTELRFNNYAEASILLDSVVLHPDIWKLFDRKTNIDLLLTGYGGRAAGRLDFPGIFFRGRPR